VGAVSAVARQQQGALAQRDAGARCRRDAIPAEPRLRGLVAAHDADVADVAIHVADLIAADDAESAHAHDAGEVPWHDVAAAQRDADAATVGAERDTDATQRDADAGVAAGGRRDRDVSCGAAWTAE